MINRTVVGLMFCQLVGALGSIILVTLGGIVGAGVAPSPAMATLPLSVMVLCVACTTVPAALFMGRVGRKRGFMLSAVVGIAGVLVVAQSLLAHSFLLLCAGMGLYGVHMAFVQQYRFAAVESVDVVHASRAISIVLLGAIGGAVLGPEYVALGRDLVGDTQYVGTMLALAATLGLVLVVMSCLRFEHRVDEQIDDSHARPLREIARHRSYIIAVLCAGVGYGVMTFVMTATPLSMHVHDGFSIEQTSNVVRSHVIAMYAPSLVSGLLMERFGVIRMMTVGALLLLATIMVGFAGQALVHYTAALIALGVGWNFLYIGGTTLLTRSYRASERFKAQALNDLSIFAISATASLLSGTVMGWFGWSVVMGVALPPLVIVLFALFMLRARRDLAHPVL